MSCTKAVSTDLSMVDIANLGGLRAELAQLRTLVATLEARLTQKEQREVSSTFLTVPFHLKGCSSNTPPSCLNRLVPP